MGMRIRALCLLAPALLLAGGACPGKAPGKPSILFLNIDDLNDWNGVLRGHPQAVTPNLERLARSGLTFTNAICPSPVCFPSRTALFTGIHPARSGALSNFNWGRPWRFYAGEAVTLPKHLEAQGWSTRGAGKNFHGGNRPEFQHYFPQPREPRARPGTGYSAGPLGWGVAEVPYEQMPDHLVVNWGIEQIQSTDAPLFLSLGIYKPHVRWILPQESFDRYPSAEFREPVRADGDLRDLPPRLRLLAHNEAKFGQGYHEKLRRDGQVKSWARAYLAAVTFADEQLGRLLEAWQASPHAEHGLIVLWSDHGFMLGEKEGWGKFKPWYDAIHSNLMIAGPGIPPGETCDKAVSLLDLYPTLLDKLGLEPPASQTLDGKSLLPLLEDPDREWEEPVVLSHEEDGIRYDVVLDNRYRMTRLITGETELYDLQEDPNEWRNLAESDAHQPVRDRLSRFLTFRLPALSGEGWLEAEKIPCQTSADFGRRGNFHYPRPNAEASGGAYLVAELRQGKGSYLDFVWHAEPGEYDLALTFGPLSRSAHLSLEVAAVVEDAGKASEEYPMTPVGPERVHVQGPTRTFTTQQFGRLTIARAGRHLLRLKSQDQDPQVLRLDRLQLKPMSPHKEAAADPGT